MATVLPTRLAQLRFRHLQLLDLVAALGTMRKAAQAMHITQPAASLMMRELEAVLGVALFERTRRGMVPTRAASAVLDRSRAILGELRAAAARETDEGELLRIGALPRVMLHLMPGVVQRIQAEWPQLRLAFVEGVALQLLPALRRGEVDCVIARLTHDVLTSANPAEFDQTVLYEEGMCLLAGPAHPLARKQHIALAELLEADWILPPARTEAREVFTNTFLRHGLSPPPARIESLSVVSSMALVREGRYLTIGPEAVAREQQRLHLVRILPVGVEMASLAPISLLSRPSSRVSAALDRFRGMVVECARARGQPAPAGSLTAARRKALRTGPRATPARR